MGKRAATALLLCLLVALPIRAAQQAPTALASLAAQMAPGTWAELATINTTPTFAATTGGVITVYTDDMVWDPVSRQAFFIGAAHIPPEGPQFVSYTESTNTWQRLPRPTWLSSQVFFHGYDHTAIDAADGIVYHRSPDAKRVYRYTVASQAWSQTPDLPFGDPTGIGEALEYFPELGGLVWVNPSGGFPGNVYLYRESTNQWTRLASGLAAGTSWQQAEYNPKHKVMVFTIGGKFYKLSSSGQVTPLADPAVLLYSGSGYNGILTVDPVSGTYLVLTPDSREFYTYDVLTDTWQAQPSPTKPNLANTGVIATPLSSYGVTFFVSSRSVSRAYLYKHSPGGGLPVDSDGDGLPDSWEMLHFGNLAQGAGGDPDSDGQTNFQEYQAGTNPNSAAGGGGGGGSSSTGEGDEGCGATGLEFLAMVLLRRVKR